MSEPLAVLLIGCGMIAGGYDALSPAPVDPTAAAGAEDGDGAVFSHAGFRLLACVEPDPLRRAAFAARWGVPHAFPSLEAALGSGLAFDVASICTPDPQHAADLERLLAVPLRAVLCEKPMTTDPVRSERLAAAWQAAGRPLLVNYTRRFDPLLGTLAAGAWGAPQRAVGIYTKGVRHNGAHLIDLLHWLLGPLTAERVLDRRFGHTDDDPTVDALLRTADGAPVYLLGADHRQFTLFELTILTAAGRIDITESGSRIRRRRAAPSPRFPSHRLLDAGETVATGLDRALCNVVDDLHRAATAGIPPRSGPDNALAAKRVCEALRRAALTPGAQP